MPLFRCAVSILHFVISRKQKNNEHILHDLWRKQEFSNDAFIISFIKLDCFTDYHATNFFIVELHACMHACNVTIFRLCLFLLSKSWWSDLHWCRFQWIVIIFPSQPIDTVSKRVVCTVVIQTIQIRLVTIFKPPTTFVHASTVSRIKWIIVGIFCRECCAVMVWERVSRCTYK